MKQKTQRPTNKTQRNIRFYTIVAGAVVIVISIIGILVAMWWSNKPAMVLRESLDRTLALRQLSFKVTVTPVGAAATSEDLTMTGKYKNGAGLAADAESNVTTDGIRTTRASRWVIDKSGAVYFNLASVSSKVVNASPLLTPDIVDKMAQGTRIITEKNKDVWVKLGTAGTDTDDGYGVRSCLLRASYLAQSDSGTLRDSLKQLVRTGGMNVTHLQSSEGKSTYEVTANDSKLATVSDTYASSKLYNLLADCNSSQYKATKQRIADTLKKMTIKVTVDDAQKTVSSATVSFGTGSDLTITLSPARDVTITVPTVTQPTAPNPNETSAEYLQRISSFLYKNLTFMQEELKKREPQAQ